LFLKNGCRGRGDETLKSWGRREWESLQSGDGDE